MESKPKRGLRICPYVASLIRGDVATELKVSETGRVAPKIVRNLRKMAELDNRYHSERGDYFSK